MRAETLGIRGHAEVMEFRQRLRSEDSSLRSKDLTRRTLERFGRKVHPRSVERALVRQEKNVSKSPPAT